MKFEVGLGLWGMQAFILNPRHHAKLYREMLDEVRWAEELGFDTIWLTEHHVWYDGYVPSLLTAAGALAGVTNRIRIGTSCLLLPQHDPLRVAEAAAVMDNISGGRLELGVSVGYRDIEYDTVGISRRERGARMDEMLDILHLAWTEERFSYHGRFFHYDRVRISPKPIQRPIPVWVGGWAKPVLRRAGQRGLHLMGARPEDWPAYLEAAQQAGIDPSRVKMTVGSDVWVEDDEEEAKAFMRPIARYLYYDQLGGWGFFQNPATGRQVFFDQPQVLEMVAYAATSAVIVGNPKTVVAALRQRLARSPAEVNPHLFLRVRFNGAPPARMRRCLELLSREVIPALREQEVRRP